MLLEKERAVSEREDKVTRYLLLNFFFLNQWHSKLTTISNKRSLWGFWFLYCDRTPDSKTPSIVQRKYLHHEQFLES